MGTRERNRAFRDMHKALVDFNPDKYEKNEEKYLKEERRRLERIFRLPKGEESLVIDAIIGEKAAYYSKRFLEAYREHLSQQQEQ